MAVKLHQRLGSFRHCARIGLWYKQVTEIDMVTHRLLCLKGTQMRKCLCRSLQSVVLPIGKVACHSNLTVNESFGADIGIYQERLNRRLLTSPL